MLRGHDDGWRTKTVITKQGNTSGGIFLPEQASTLKILAEKTSTMNNYAT